MTSERPHSRTNAVPKWKRILDLIGCTLALPFLAAAYVFMAIWLALVSPGPLFFKQQRVGFRGRRFTLYKFRTMRTDATASSHQAHYSDLIRSQRPMQKLDGDRDGRLIPGAWLLRAAGVDELAQVINIFKGDMSIVGPRPCIPYEYEQYSPRHRRRFLSIPGLTGLWQVSGKNRTTFDEMIRLDIAYRRRASLGLDLAIIAKTVPALVTQIADIRALRRGRPGGGRLNPVSERPAVTVTM